MKGKSRAAYLIVAVILIALVFHFARYHIIDRDESQAAELAHSVSESLCYCTSAIPPVIYPVSFSTNGPLVYVAAFFFAISHLNPDIALVADSVGGTVLILTALYALEPWLVVIAALAFLGWPAVHSLTTSFLGEMWAIGFSLAGVALLVRRVLVRQIFRSLQSAAFLLACICFGMAMESKLISAPSIVTIVFALAYEALPVQGLRSRLINLVRASAICVATTVGALAALFISIALSVAHSVRTPAAAQDIYRAPLGFISDMVLQGTTKSDPNFFGHLVARCEHFDQPLFLVLFLAAAIVLLIRNWTYLPFLLITLVMWLKIGDNEFHIVIAFYLLLVLGAFEGQAVLNRFFLEPRARIAVGRIVAACGLIVFLTSATLTYISRPIPTGPIPSFEERRYVATGLGLYHYSQQLVDAIRRQRYVATSGYWYFPEMVIREDFHFYDRTAPATTLLTRDQVALLIDSSNVLFPPTSVENNCGRIIAKDGPIVLCRLKPGRDTDYSLHVLSDVRTPTTGPNLLSAPSFSAAYQPPAAPTRTMRVTFLRGAEGARVSLNGAQGATQLFHGVRVRPGDTIIVSGVLIVSGAAMPRLGGASVLYMDGAAGPIAGEGVDQSNDPGKYPFAFPVTPIHPQGQILFFVHVATASSTLTTVGLSDLTVRAAR